MQEFFQMLQYLLAANSIDIIVGKFNYDLLNVPLSNFLDFLDVQMVNKSAHIYGSLIDHVNIKKTLMAEFFTNVTVEDLHFSDHAVTRITIDKNNVDFHMNP